MSPNEMEKRIHELVIERDALKKRVEQLEGGITGGKITGLPIDPETEGNYKKVDDETDSKDPFEE